MAEQEEGEGIGGGGIRLASTLLSSLEGSYPRVRKLGRESILGRPKVRINEDQAYKGLGDTVPPHSQAGSTPPSACSALRAFNGCCNKFHFISFQYISFHFISFHFISFHFISFHFISFYISLKNSQLLKVILENSSTNNSNILSRSLRMLRRSRKGYHLIGDT
jgi:hypothetical protein